MNKSYPATFIQCWDTEANKPQNLVTRRLFPDAEAARQFIAQFYRRLEYRSHEPWSEKDHGHRPLFPVPAKYVQFDPKKEIVVPPDLRKRSVLVQRKPFPRVSFADRQLKKLMTERSLRWQE